MNAIDCMNFPYYQQLKPHCQKCGRRSRSHNIYKNNRRVENEEQHCYQFKCKRQQCLFPTELPLYPIVTQTNDNHSISKKIHSRNSSSKSNRKNVLIDQLIQVQQLNDKNYKTQNHSYDMDNDYKRDEYRSFTDTMNSDSLKRVQQMVYLRENINNLSYREVHFSNEYIILKRLEEKNNLINQNRFKVDHYFRSLKLQYQTISTLFQNVTIASFTYSKQGPSQSNLIVKTPFKQCPFSENRSVLSTDQSPPTIVEMDDTSSIVDPIDSPMFIKPYNEYEHQQYSQNATQSYMNIDHLIKTKNQNLVYDTAVIVDVRKCPQLITHQPSIQDNWNHIKPTWSIPFPENNQQIITPNQSIYFDQYSQFMDIQQPQIMVFPCSQNSNSTHQIDPIIYHPIYNESISNISYETTWFPLNIKESNKYQCLTTNHLSPTDSSIQHTTDISSSIHQISEHQNSFPMTSTNTSNEKNNQSIKYTQTLNKIKQILNTLQKKLLNKSLPTTQISNEIDQSISTTMTSDSLVTTYSVSSTLPRLNKNISQLSYNKSIINIENGTLDSLNNNYYSNRSKSKIKLLNSAKNINTNQQTIEDDSTQSRSRRSISRRIAIQYMSPSFMFVLQILLVICLINRIFMYYFFGIVPTDPLVSIIIDNSQFCTPISEAKPMNDEKFSNFLSSFF